MTKKLSSSPDRGSFSKQIYTKRLGIDASDESALNMLDFIDKSSNEKKEMEQTPEWAENNMEHDMRTTEWFAEKVRASEVYAQNLYAAMCNQDWLKLDVFPLLKNETWSCSWRSAGGIVADLRQEGDYIDWYCSGIRDNSQPSDEDFAALTPEQQEYVTMARNFVPEGVVTDEIQEDLKRLGWLMVDMGQEG